MSEKGVEKRERISVAEFDACVSAGFCHECVGVSVRGTIVRADGLLKCVLILISYHMSY